MAVLERSHTLQIFPVCRKQLSFIGFQKAFYQLVHFIRNNKLKVFCLTSKFSSTTGVLRN